ncbi:polysaccharide deacetylase family protein [Hydrogenibacillus sp. N12]|uniref:polysaccharide deacetylase family protein n=1 Tax=Hydrogenibacillus sp. N12 TaxID=2866627 RepID=UPI001C7DBDE8|nr:polysaccharide deacetylase family protein [Hydrogenibacillus sp. N12]QZA33398.1 polysaccharide deacetylase family protein [Hydrogenibacillus sp. N12]
MRTAIGAAALLLALYAAYVGLSWTVFRIFGWKVLKRRRGEAGFPVYLTFDDGPHPVYTPRLLDLLKRYDARATFFVVGEAARRHPELLRRMIAEGHAIGLHNERHVPNWLVPPWRTARSLGRLQAEIEAITGRRPVLYRPPWGLIGLADGAVFRTFRVVLWSVMPRDWERRSDPTAMKWRIFRRLTPGAIVLLHDSGETFGADPTAPERMLAMLEDFFETVRSVGLKIRFLPLPEEGPPVRPAGEAGTEKVGTTLPWRVQLYFAFEALHHRLFRYRPLLGPDGFLYVEDRRYAGPPVTLEGESLRPGERGLNLHFNNRLLVEALFAGGSEFRRMVRLKREAEAALRLLARYAMEMRPEARGVFGYSALHRGIRPFGFAVVPMRPTPHLALAGAYMRWLLRFLHPEGDKRLEAGDGFVPHWVVMPRAVLLRRYGPAGSSDAPRRNESIRRTPSAAPNETFNREGARAPNADR